jgi:hypothetical protein
MGGHRLDTAARTVLIASEPSADADGVLGVDAGRVTRLDGSPVDGALLLTSDGRSDSTAWFLACLGHATVAIDRVALDPQGAFEPELIALGRPVVVTITGVTVGERVAQQVLAMTRGARVVVTDHPREARRVAAVIDATRGCAR